MPELPEVETVKNGLIRHIINKKIFSIKINADKLRYPINKDKFSEIVNLKVREIQRRGKHLIIFLNDDLQLIVHLGMSGVIKVENKKTYSSKKHDHILIEFEKDILIYNDPRRFGYWLVNNNNIPFEHKVLINHGVEPLTEDFDVKYLETKLKHSSKKIKQAIMDNSTVVGVGNIYASEALFKSNILPTRISKTLSKKEITKLVHAIKEILKIAIEQGGTTLKDYKNTEGKPGYFSQKLNVYGRAKQPCYICKSEIKSEVIGQRNTYFCTKCQK
ncbi:bifunctional DNA-formamidopyrimidine glycosylase/DNA-(apurinic or apyrimidinic site) lyase [Francisella frigiditurris]|uniref:Formamidopyrimidine-DNA glycosylase n=1 Tax=Francisella frigiditurris TaxID=1542390 RepID=A0A1J0KW92_9GAMM|nr:bifunctional DNA-formamidopyrimidine glycosylase/DNA-(apurinic or apyrimidinic site) lyase [Francisella frigiditurris]APC97886.1 DNA-formamidopyrimidine glycosylase [Francisella frigiditurris]